MPLFQRVNRKNFDLGVSDRIFRQDRRELPACEPVKIHFRTGIWAVSVNSDDAAPGQGHDPGTPGPGNRRFSALSASGHGFIVDLGAELPAATEFPTNRSSEGVAGNTGRQGAG